MLHDIICKYLKKYFDQSDDYITGCSVDYPYFKENYKMIPISLSRQHAFYYWKPWSSRRHNNGFDYWTKYSILNQTILLHILKRKGIVSVITECVIQTNKCNFIFLQCMNSIKQLNVTVQTQKYQIYSLINKNQLQKGRKSNHKTFIKYDCEAKLNFQINYY